MRWSSTRSIARMAVPVDRIGPRRAQRDRSPCHACRPAAARTAVPPRGTASARRGSTRRRSRPTYSATAQASQSRLSEAWVRAAKPVRPSCKQVEPVDHVAFEELLRGVQQDLPPGQRRVHPDQVHRVLQLVAEAEGPAGLIESAPGPDPLGQRLVLQPVQIADRTPGCSVSTRTVSISAATTCACPSRLVRAAAGSWYLRIDRLGLRRRSSAWPSTTATVRSPRAGMSSGRQQARRSAGRRPSRPSRRGLAVLDQIRAERRRGPARRTGRACVSTRSGRRRHGDERRAGAEDVPRVLEEQRAEPLARNASAAARSVPAGRPAPSGNRAPRGSAARRRRRSRTVSR